MLSQVLWAQKIVSGYIVDAESKESLPGASVLAAQKGTTSNNYGYFLLNIPENVHEITVSYVGYTTQTLNLQSNKTDSLLTIRLKPALQLQEVQVVAQRNTVRESGAMNLLQAKVSSMPVMLGEPDIFKTMQMLPGVGGGAEGMVDIYVRGGDKDENLVLLDDVPIYNTSHTGGFFSNINAELIKDVKLYTSNFPARYAGRVSSVIDIRTREGNLSRFNAGVSWSPLIASAFVETPIVKEKSALLLSARRCYFDVLSKIVNIPAYMFYDLNAKYHHKLSDTDHLYLSLYYGRDGYTDLTEATDFRSEFGLKYGNTVGSFRWNHVFSNAIFSNTTLTYSNYAYKSGYESEDVSTTAAYTANSYFRSDTKDFRLKNDFEYRPSNAHTLRLGGSVAMLEFSPEDRIQVATKDAAYQQSDSTLWNVRSLETNLYFEDEIQWSKWKLNLGFNTSIFSSNGKSYYSPEPRLSAEYAPTEQLKIQFGYVQMSQNTHIVTQSGKLLPEDIWIPTTDSIPPVTSRQVSLGLQAQVWGLQLNLGSYYKTYENVLEKRWNNAGQSVFQLLEIGKGRSFGSEISFEKKWQKFDMLASYTYSRSFRTFENINFGTEFPFMYDRPHELKMMSSYRANNRISFSINCVYRSGNNTNIASSYVPSYQFYEKLFNNSQSQNNPIAKYFGERNSYRLPAYLRLDFDISLKLGRAYKHTIRLGAYNATNHFNAVSAESWGNKISLQSTYGITPYIAYNWRLH
jgi:hypothetical protein